MPLGIDASTLPFGPCTATVLPRSSTFTPCGSTIGFLPTLDIFYSFLSSSPDLVQASSTFTKIFEIDLVHFAQNFAANALFARLPPRHHALGRSEDVDAQSAQHPADLIAAYVDAATGPRDAGDGVDHRLIVRPVLQVHAQHTLALFFAGLEVGDEALFLQDAGDLQLQLGSRHVHLRVSRPLRITDAR